MRQQQQVLIQGLPGRVACLAASGVHAVCTPAATYSGHGLCKLCGSGLRRLDKCGCWMYLVCVRCTDFVTSDAHAEFLTAVFVQPATVVVPAPEPGRLCDPPGPTCRVQHHQLGEHQPVDPPTPALRAHATYSRAGVPHGGALRRGAGGWGGACTSIRHNCQPAHKRTWEVPGPSCC